MNIRKLASVKQITSIDPIPKKDRIELAIVDNGWQVVVEKGLYQVGDKIIYLEPDSWVPRDLYPLPYTPKLYNGVLGNNLKVVKFGGEYSLGLILPLKEDLPLGTDLTQALNIQKYESRIPDVGKPIPFYIRSPFLDRVQNLAEEIKKEPSRLYEVTHKLDGQCFIAYYDGKVNICSHNVILPEGDNVYWNTAKKEGVVEAIEGCTRYVLYGEIIGPNLNRNKEKFSENKIFFFDIWDNEEQCYLKYPQWYKVLKDISPKLKRIPEIPEAPEPISLERFDFSVEKILEFAEGPSLNTKRREGVVFKSLDQNFRFKAVSNYYLINYG